MGIPGRWVGDCGVEHGRGCVVKCLGAAGFVASCEADSERSGVAVGCVGWL